MRLMTDDDKHTHAHAHSRSHTHVGLSASASATSSAPLGADSIHNPTDIGYVFSTSGALLSIALFYADLPARMCLLSALVIVIAIFVRWSCFAGYAAFSVRLVESILSTNRHVALRLTLHLCLCVLVLDAHTHHHMQLRRR